MDLFFPDPIVHFHHCHPAIAIRCRNFRRVYGYDWNGYEYDSIFVAVDYPFIRRVFCYNQKESGQWGLLSTYPISAYAFLWGKWLGLAVILLAMMFFS